MKNSAETVKFGETVSFTDLYEFYRTVYTIFYDPIVLKCHVLLLKGLEYDELKSRMKKYVLLFYKQIDDLLYEDIKDIYECGMDAKLVQLRQQH